MPNWYANAALTCSQLMVLAGAADKIRSLKITSPTVKLFLHAYEKMVDWSNEAITDKATGQERAIQSEADLQQFIGDNLIKNLEKNMDRNYPDNNYVKDIDVEDLYNRHPPNQPPAPEIVAAYNMLKTDPAKAKQMALDKLYKNKASTFDQWWRFMTGQYSNHVRLEDAQGNVIAHGVDIVMKFSKQQDKAFVFMMLDKMFDASPPNKRTAPQLFSDSVEDMHKKVSALPDKELASFSIWKRYDKDATEKASGGIENIRGALWMLIPGRTTDPKNYNENILKMNRVSPSSWCVAGDAAARMYMETKSFYVLFGAKGEKAKASILFRDQDKGVEQIRGDRNGAQVIAEDCWREVRDLVRAKGLKVEGCNDWSALQKHIKLEDELKDPEQFKEYLKSVEVNFQNYIVLPPEFKNRPDATAAAIKGYAKFVKDRFGVNPNNDGVRPPPELENEPEIREAVVAHWVGHIGQLDAGHGKLPDFKDMPEYVQKDLRIKAASVKPYTNWIAREPEAIFSCPDWVVDLPEAKAAYNIGINRWKEKMLSCDNIRAFWENSIPEAIPQRVRLLPQIGRLYQVLLKRQEIRDGAVAPKDLNRFEDEVASQVEIIRQISINPDYYKEKLTPFQQQNPQYRHAWVETLARRFENVGPGRYGVVNQFGVPIVIQEIEGIERIKQAKLTGWIRLLDLLSRTPSSQAKMFGRCPPEIQEKIKAEVEKHPSLRPLFKGDMKP